MGCVLSGCPGRNSQSLRRIQTKAPEGPAIPKLPGKIQLCLSGLPKIRYQAARVVILAARVELVPWCLNTAQINFRWP